MGVCHVPASDRGEVIVTGAANGIGFALVQRLLADGYRVSAWDRTCGELATLSHDRLAVCALDVRDKPAMMRAAETVRTRGRIAGLVTCATVAKAAPFLEIDDQLWDTTFDVNLNGTLFACQAVLPIMRRQRGGNIVLFASMSARAGLETNAPYNATKGGILGLARSLALEVANDNIRVNTVSPAVTDTARRRATLSDQRKIWLERNIPLRRIGRPEEMAEAAMFLLGDDSSFLTGQDIRVSGGFRVF
jgi:NAD(P)-dependent dehydrogenase (short-subunit alcohol dehydrogenase family)